MFDAFSNFVFGKKKSNAESEREKQPEGEDFVVIRAASDQQVDKELERNFSETNFPKNPYGESFLKENMPTSSSKSEETCFQIMPLQDVPFTINSSLSASAKLDQIWASMASIFSSVSQYKPYQEDYDFSLEKSVISETVQK